METKRIAALAVHLGISPEDIEVSTYDSELFDAEGNEYLVLTDSEADERAAEDIEQSVWAFNASFLVGYMPDGVDTEIIETVQQAKSEDASPMFLALIGDKWDKFVSDAISSDGRGHFLSGYDGEENEETIDGTMFYIYRTN